MIKKITLLTLCSILLTGCSTLTVQNISEAGARVSVRVPDSSKNFVNFIPAGNIHQYYSEYGGSYSVTILPDERYRELLNNLNDEISRRLFEERSTLTASDVSALVQRLNEVNTALTDLDEFSASCSGTMAEDKDSIATIIYDNSANQMTITCN